MKSIVLYSIICVLAGSSAFLGYSRIKSSAVIAVQEKTIEKQEKLIKELSQQEAVAIHITNQFKSNAVMGKVVVDADVKNVAEQCASILKAELVKKQ